MSSGRGSGAGHREDGGNTAYGRDLGNPGIKVSDSNRSSNRCNRVCNIINELHSEIER